MKFLVLCPKRSACSFEIFKDINKCVLLGCQFEKVSHCFKLCLLKFANGWDFSSCNPSVQKRMWFQCWLGHQLIDHRIMGSYECFCLCTHCEYWICTHLAPEIWSAWRPEKGVMKTTCFSREISMQRDFSGVGYRKEGKALALFGTFGMRFLDWLLHNVAWTVSFSLLGQDFLGAGLGTFWGASPEFSIRVPWRWRHVSK